MGSNDAAEIDGKDSVKMNRRTTSAFAGAIALLDRGVRDQLRLSWRLLRDGRVSALKYALPAVLGLYVLSPVDAVPDFLLGIGQTDDLGVVIAGVLLLARVIPRLAPDPIIDEHLRAMGNGGPPAPVSRTPDEVIDARFRVRG